MLNDKCLEKILKMSINVVDGSQKKIIIDFDKNEISSTQNYKGKDPDVSDVAIDFYDTIYHMDNKLVVGKKLVDKNFCGDTMTSFKTLKQLVNTEKIQDCEIQKMTHCLANFWILPMDVGHSSSWTAKRKLMYLSKSAKCNDEMGKFLKYYCKHYKEYKKQFKNYADKFPSENFEEKHFLKDIEYKELESIKSFQQICNNRIKNIVQQEGMALKGMIENNEYYIVKGNLDLGIIANIDMHS